MKTVVQQIKAITMEYGTTTLTKTCMSCRTRPASTTVTDSRGRPKHLCDGCKARKHTSPFASKKKVKT